MIIQCDFCKKSFKKHKNKSKDYIHNFCSRVCFSNYSSKKNVLSSIGKTFGILKVTSFAYIKNKQSYVNCKCNCGNEYVFPLIRLKNALVRSCIKCLDKYRFMKYVNIVDKNTWIWTGYKNKKGYGTFKSNYCKSILAHRVSYELFVGKIKYNLCVCHRDDVPLNICPSNLFLATTQENTKDMITKNRQCKGEKKPQAKLKESNVVYILKSNNKHIILASKFNVSVSSINDIKKRRTWKDVEDQ